MIVKGWSSGAPNGRTGAGYGVRITHRDRDRYFCPEWPSVTVELDQGATIQVNLSSSFWRRCSELRKQEIGKWMLDRGLAPWPKGRPPQMRLEPIGQRRFRLSR